MDELTPMLRQYHQLKKEHQDSILMFRMGDFYEMFFDDAISASKALEITLTARGKGTPNSAPMCGVPYHAVDGYVARLVRMGYRVALCDQMEDSRRSKGLVKREVVRVVTPGTFTDPSQMAAGEHNFLCSLIAAGDSIGAAYLDLSTGDLTVSEVQGEGRWEALADQLELFSPREILLSEGSEMRDKLPSSLRSRASVQVPEWAYSRQTATRSLLSLTGAASLAGFGLQDGSLAVRAAGGAVHYLQETQRTELKHLHRISTYCETDRLVLDATTRRNLELTANLFDGTSRGSLLELLDRTCTPMGSRALREVLLRPFSRVAEVEPRLDAVEAWLRQGSPREQARVTLGRIRDLERLLSRITLRAASPREFLDLASSLAALAPLKQVLRPIEGSELLADLESSIDPLEDVVSLVASGISEDPPALLRDGGYIRDGFNEELDQLRSIRKDGHSFLASLETRERQRTGIATLKVRYNRVFGYYLEVSRANLGLVPSDYERKQTLVGAERFITPELKDYEERVLTAQEKIDELETELLERIRARVAGEAVRIKSTAMAVAQVDLLCGLAEAAAAYDYVRPKLRADRLLQIRGGRHPVVERLQSEQRFVPNETELCPEERQIVIITGPNMGGKSTYLRQVALIVLMAQAGSFVPASEAEIGMVDRIFCRVGASDNLARGQSTFMVEMLETANILHHATPRSLVVLDEIGRGTATFDGLSLAWAVAEYLHEDPRLGCKTLFATHYHELTELALTLPRVRNYRIAVREWNDQIRFLYRVEEGSADRSYGIQVARLAGLPREVIRRAGEVLHNLEMNELNREGVPRMAGEQARRLSEPAQIRLFAEEPDPLREALRRARPEEMTPLEALNLLSELKRKLEGTKS
ncbi:MAG TPA: DNA mismatch repair protein MutS [Candidatus Polarisedimenticolia bacterium]|nr:DNA mismatch repair protein MutS [Candidatus Polarisedimenticolia bacterium]